MSKKFKKELDSKMSSNPKDYSEITNWDDLFELQSRKDGANYQILKAWLKTHFEVPKLKN